MSTEAVSGVATAPAVADLRLPPAVRGPKLLQGIGFTFPRRWFMERMTQRHGPVFMVRIPVFGNVVVVADPRLAKRCSPPAPRSWATSSPT